MNELVKIGNTQKAHGIKGELKLNIAEHFIDDLFDTEAVFIEIKGQKVPYFVEDIQEGNVIFIKLEGVDSRSDAELLMQKDLYLRREDISISDELISSGGMHFKYLEGFMIFDDLEGQIAVIDEVAAFPQQEIAYIFYQNRTILIPLNDELILEVDKTQKKVLMNLPEGILVL
jgi:16S rRNA processing protein RimM